MNTLEALMQLIEKYANAESLADEVPGAWADATRLHAAIRTALSSALAQWRDIGSAPLDGTRILIFCEGRVTISRWYVHYLNGKPNPHRMPEWEQPDMYGGFGGYSGPIYPTHWQPLPPPPTEDTK